ncbi:MAG TPA: hypothetical protein PKY77_13840 [Phycisphaerae bacterium]|nr:hypothetical protein [Phycisphaerae bacterium]HRY70481.1 hypothetical protein [Phycisphaerae bacterium]HSA28210.1 hypothetical protein [Phycisphaerae bacterium]
MTHPDIIRVMNLGQLEPDPAPWRGAVYVQAIFEVLFDGSEELPDEQAAGDAALETLEDALKSAASGMCPPYPARRELLESADGIEVILVEPD